MTTKVHLYPQFAEEDKGDGGIRRVVEQQLKILPRMRVEFAEDPAEADVIACHIEIPPQYLQRFPDKPFVAHCHGLYWSEYEWLSWAYKANAGVLEAIRVADAVTAPTEWVAQILRRHTSRPITVIPHGVSMQEWQTPPKQHRGYVLWNKTREDPVCSPDDFNLLARTMHDVPFVSTFGNDGPNVQITGRLPFVDAKEVVCHAGVYLVTTRETFGIGTLEAMAAGVPIVGYNFGGQAEFVEHMKDGWLVEPGDVQGLVEGINWALTNRDGVGLAAKEKAKQFSWDNAMLAYRDLYREVVERHEQTMLSPRVSIIVPAYNLERTLPDTLDSIIAQTDADWECIIVDDASPDSCGDIADTYAEHDARFRVIHNEENQYLAAARNTAIKDAKGAYIIAVDADDKLPPLAVQTLADALDEDRRLDVVYGGVLFTNEDGVTPTNYGVQGVTPGHSNWPFVFDPAKQLEGFNLLPYSSMFRRSAWEDVGGYRTRLRTAEDADFWMRLTSYGFGIRKITDADMLIYRNREGSMSRVNNERRHEYMRWYPWAKDITLAPAGVAGVKAVSLLTPRVSVIIPVGPGHERYVQDAVDSVAAQSYRLWECIVVNDSGSKLNLPSWVRVIDAGNDRDAGSSRNRGIAAARSDYFVPLDADDFLQPDALQFFVTAYVEEGGGDRVVYSDFFEDPTEPGVWSVYHTPEFSCEHLRRNGVVYAVTAFIPVELWRKVGGYATGMAWEDMDFQLRCAQAGACTTHVKAPLFTYRKFTGKRRNWDDPLDLEERKKQMVEVWGEYLIGGKDFMGCGCAQSSVVASMPTTPQMAASLRTNGEAVLIEYIGGNEGNVQYRGNTGMIYEFSKSESTKWVDGRDASVFLSHKDFRASQQDPQASTEPVLVA